jgi:hypothetical protein
VSTAIRSSLRIDSVVKDVRERWRIASVTERAASQLLEREERRVAMEVCD